jgi:hypothetical protein
VNVFMFAIGLGSGTVRRLESEPTDANEPIGIIITQNCNSIFFEMNLFTILP